MRQALILVGGLGTRLGEYTRSTPKPLLPIAGDKRFLDYMLENIARHGLREIILLAGHLGDAVVERYAGQRIRGAEIKVIQEPAPAGTAGALVYAADLLDDIFLMTNGDSLIDVNYLALAQALSENDVGALALRRAPDAARFGRVNFNEGRIHGFHEKDTTFTGPALISGGAYVLRREVLNLIGRTPCSIETDVFPQLAARGCLAGFETDGYFVDIGLPETLHEARATLPAVMRRSAAFFDRDGTLVRDEGYTHKTEDLVWQPDAISAIRSCNDARRLVIVVTNQAGIARGYYDVDAMHAFHDHMQCALREHGAHIDAFYHCPFHEAGVLPDLAIADHPDRKPNPGMIERAIIDWDIDRTRSFVVGDAPLDLQAAKAAGLPGTLAAPGELIGIVERYLRAPAAPALAESPQAMLSARAARARTWLFDHALPLWWERGFDLETRTFRESLSLSGDAIESPRRIRVQARQTGVFARAGRLGWTGPWRAAVEAGAAVLIEKGMRPDGGTRHLLDETGSRCVDERRDLYDTAFVLFGLAEASIALGDRRDLLTAAGRLTRWLEDNWSDPEGGFLEGDITPTPPRRQNPHMHVFEAFLSLFEASGDAAYLDRAHNIGALFTNRFFNTTYGALPEYFDAGWSPLRGETGRISEPGHQFEWSWLLRRCKSLGGNRFGSLPERLRAHAEAYGVDRELGSVWDEVSVEGKPRTRSMRLWPQTERLKANLVRLESDGDFNAGLAAAQAFDALWAHLDTPTLGLWRERRDAGGAFLVEAAPASSFYHVMLALFELLRVTQAFDQS